MSSALFANKNIELTVFYIIKKNKNNVAFPVIVSEEKAQELISQKKEVHSIKTEWKMPNWSTQNELIANATTYNHLKGENEINHLKWRDLKIKSFLVRWDVKDDKGNEIPLSVENIDAMHPDVVFALISEFDKLSTVDEEEQSKN